MRQAGIVAAIAAVGAGLALAPTAAARAPAVDAALRGADAPVAQLETDSTRTLPGGAAVSQIDQEVDGVPVQGAGAVVLDPVTGPPELLFDKTHDGLDAPGEPRVSRSAAIDAALEAVGAGRLAGGPSARRVIVPGGAGTLAWEVTQSAYVPVGDFVVTVDAATGEVLSKHNLILRATGNARLFVPNAVVENDGYSGIKDKQDKDSATLTALRTPVTLKHLDNGQACLKGKWARVRKGVRKKVCRDSLEWPNVTRSKNNFEALMAYYHVNEAQEYIQSLGLAAINEESQDLFANSLSADNSFYWPSRDEIQLGQGGVDDGEDADVIVHEYGHAVQDAQNPDAFRSFNDDTGAQGEGFSDYLAAVYSTEVSVSGDPEWTACIMEWDATSYDQSLFPPTPGICLRRADNPNTLDEQEDLCGGTEIHCIGEVWSSALLKLRTALGDDGGGDSIIDKVVLASHEMLPPSPSFEEASAALIDADEQAYGAADHCVAIRDELVVRELLTSDPC